MQAFPPYGDFAAFVSTLVGEDSRERWEEAQPLIVPTGFAELDALLDGGLRASQLCLITGVVGVGTSSLATAFATQAALGVAVRTAFIATDSPMSEVFARVVACHARVPLRWIRTGHLGSSGTARLLRVEESLSGAPLWVRGTIPKGESMDTVLRSADEMTQPGGARFLVVDGLGQTEPDNRALIMGLRALARERGLVVVMTAKSVVPTERRDQVPALWDVRGADDVVDLFDLVLTLHRDDHLEAESRRPGEADVVISKHRYGRSGAVIPLHFMGHEARFTDPPAT